MTLPRIMPDTAPPPIHWWGNAYYRVWKDWEQLVIVIRLPWWRGAKIWLSGLATLTCTREQACVSWRRREGWRKGWRPV